MSAENMRRLRPGTGLGDIHDHVTLGARGIRVYPAEEGADRPRVMTRRGDREGPGVPVASWKWASAGVVEGTGGRSIAPGVGGVSEIGAGTTDGCWAVAGVAGIAGIAGIAGVAGVAAVVGGVVQPASRSAG